MAGGYITDHMWTASSCAVYGRPVPTLYSRVQFANTFEIL
jgi:hypothetical protein